MRKPIVVSWNIILLALLFTQTGSTYGTTRRVERRGVVVAYDLFPASSRRHSIDDLDYYEVVLKVLPSYRSPGEDEFILIRFRHKRSMTELPERFIDGKSVFRIKANRQPKCDRVIQVTVPVGSEGVIYAQMPGLSWTPGHETETIPVNELKCFEVADDRPHLASSGR